MKRLHATVFGRVQDVGFRDYVQKHAKRLSLKGWVRNSPDGTVEVVAEGEDVALVHLILSVEKGAPLSRVDEVKTAYSAPTGEFDDFRMTN